MRLSASLFVFAAACSTIACVGATSPAPPLPPPTAFLGARARSLPVLCTPRPGEDPDDSVRWLVRVEACVRATEGISLGERGEYERGIDALKRAWELSSEPAVLWDIAQLYAESGDLEEALVHFEQVYSLAPAYRRDVNAIVGRGCIRRE